MIVDTSTVTKRDGSLAPVCLQEIQDKITSLSTGLNVNPVKVALRVCESLTENMSTSEIHEISSEACMESYTSHTDYERLAVRILIDNMNKICEPRFSAYVNQVKRTGRLSDDFVSTVVQFSREFDSMIDASTDADLSFFGLKTLVNNKYLMLDEFGNTCEKPCYLWMRVAIGIHLHTINKTDNNNTVLQDIATTYRLLQNRLYTHATPTLFNAGTCHPQFASCFLMALNEDSIEGIYSSLSEAAKISKHAGGIGLHMHNLRARNSIINSTGCVTDGLLPTLRVFNESSLLVKQAGKRPGSISIWLSPDHLDVLDFIDIRRNRGEEAMRCRDLFTGLWIPDLFVRTVINDEMWYLFSPNEAPGLDEVHGEEYEALYKRYVQEKRYRKSIKAQHIWKQICESQIETGTPYMCYKDAVNKHSNQKNIGIIKSSNLCTEIMEVSTPERVAVCNLASVCLSQFVTETGEFDFIKLAAVVRQVVKSLNHVIDGTFYPLEKARFSNLQSRPLGIGVQGWQTLLFMLKLPFDSSEARDLNKRIFAAIYYFAWDESANLAMTDGSYPDFEGSPLSKGILHCDTWDVELDSTLDWKTLRTKVSCGVRNSLLTTIMPTASTAQICANTEACEPQASNIYVRRTQAGEYEQINKYLVDSLEKLGLWNTSTRHEIIRNDGSVQAIDSIPDDLKALFRTAYELSQKTIINQAADRAPYIDQSQSMNIFMVDPTIEKVSSMHIYGWRMGLKTGMYYLRSRPRSKSQQFAIPLSCTTPVDCESCSA
jgi:ribonucleoside-diphosphate reductase alpha subunit